MGEWQRMRIVIADTQDLAEAIASRLKKLGYAVDFVGDGGEADELLRSETYNLVVLDLTLPDLDGKTMLPAGLANAGAGPHHPFRRQ